MVIIAIKIITIIKNMSQTISLTTSVADLFMVGSVYAKRLEKLGIFTVEDLLFHFPNHYTDYSLNSKIDHLQEREVVTITGKILDFSDDFTRGRLRIQKAIVSDGTGQVTLTWFNQPFLKNLLKIGQIAHFSGNIKKHRGRFSMIAPEYELEGRRQIHTGRLVPIYPETKGVSSKWLRSRIAPLLDSRANLLPTTLNTKIERTYNLLENDKALGQIHFPESKEMAENARQRFAFEEIFLTQIGSLQRRHEIELEKASHPFKIQEFKKEIRDFYQNLPFKLTKAQRRVVGEILTDLAKNRPMNRLLQGDVGSGKTVVAAMTMFFAHLNGYQSLLMAPTEILALQHYRTIKDFLASFSVEIALFTSHAKIVSEKSSIYVGTHALLSDKVILKKLGLVIIDEQHRFGVNQRAKLKEKGVNPHLLTMTATPIPRTIALTLYGDLDFSIIDEMPVGRLPVKTWLVPLTKREAAYGWIKKQNAQTFVICPLIEESESLTTVKAAKTEIEKLRKIFPKKKIGLLHGRLKPKEKENVLEDFRTGSLDILVATPVVEVGIDIPGATIMVIEAADRFGLAQLHQLRGRVGRRGQQAYCLLFSESDSEKTLARLKAMETHQVGLELAEIDLKQRGPGEFSGFRQHGFPEFKAARLTDVVLMEKARKTAQAILNEDPQLKNYQEIKEKLRKMVIKLSSQN